MVDLALAQFFDWANHNALIRLLARRIINYGHLELEPGVTRLGELLSTDHFKVSGSSSGWLNTAMSPAYSVPSMEKHR